MQETPEKSEDIGAITKRAESELQMTDSSPFSSNAYSLLKWKIAEYISDLVNESTKVANRHRADTVSAAHVEQASAYLVSSNSERFYRHVGTVGGILLGAALSNILAMTVMGQYTTISTLISILLGIVGAFMIALHIARD